MSRSRYEIDAVGVVLIMVVATWCVSSVIEVWRGTAHVGGCSCIVRDGKDGGP